MKDDDFVILSRVRSFSTPARTAVIGTFAGQAVLLAVTPALTRLVPLDAFADYQIAFAAAAVMQFLVTAGAEHRIALTDAESPDASRLTRRATISILLFGMAGLCAALVAMSIDASRLASVVASTTLIACTFAFSSVDSARLISTGQGGLLARRNITAGGLAAALQIAAALTVPHAVVLAGAIALGRASAHLFGGKAHSAPIVSTTRRATTRSRFTEGLSWSAAAVVSNAAFQAPVFIVAALVDARSAGQLALALRTAGFASTLLATAFSQGFMMRLSELTRNGDIGVVALLRRTEIRLIGLGLLFAVALGTSGPFLIPIAFGEAWTLAGWLVAILALPLGLQLVNRAVLPIFPAAGSSHTLLSLQVARLLATCGATAAVLAAGKSVPAAVAAQAGVLLVAYGLAVFLARKAAHKLDDRAARQGSASFRMAA